MIGGIFLYMWNPLAGVLFFSTVNGLVNPGTKLAMGSAFSFR